MKWNKQKFTKQQFPAGSGRITMKNSLRDYLHHLKSPILRCWFLNVLVLIRRFSLLVYLYHVKLAIEPPTPHDKQGALAGAATQKAGSDKTNPRTPTSPPSPAHTGYCNKQGLMHCQLRNYWFGDTLGFDRTMLLIISRVELNSIFYK